MKVEEKCRSLQVQGNWVELVIQEQSDLKWKSSLCNTPRGVFEFALNGMLNWLPTADNLARWGKVLSPKCPLCKGRQTLRHVLNMCPVALKDRYTWRHNSVLMELVSTLKLWHAKSNPEVTIRCDLSPDYLEGGTHTTIPPDILPTPLVPDITVQDPVKRTLTLIELTVPFDQNAQDAEDRKSAKYESLVNDINFHSGYRATLVTVEVGSRGWINGENITKLKSLCPQPSSSSPLHFLYNFQKTPTGVAENTPPRNLQRIKIQMSSIWYMNWLEDPDGGEQGASTWPGHLGRQDAFRNLGMDTT
ncbi:hypothetical protein Bbelb_355240 [Branchiostoma belcheri]|nr:hypothetical protein Bbelb_355240 [Branchiostoma belcheri]